MRRLALLGVVAVLVGCGGGSKPVSDAAELVPPSAQSFVSLQTDLGGLPHVLNRFPIGSAALKAVRQGLKLKPSMGPELDLAIFKAGTVSFTQPADEKALEAALGPKQLHARIRGWTVFTDKAPLLDLVQHHKGKLSELTAYQDAIGRLPASGIVRAYSTTVVASGLALTRSLPVNLPTANVKQPNWVAAALTSNGDELKLEVHLKGTKGPAAQSSSDLVSQIPAGSVLALGIGGFGRVSGKLKIGGVDLQSLADALGGEAIVYVRAGLPFPEVTLASKAKDPEQAVRDIGRLITKLSKTKKAPLTTTVDGVTLHDVALGAVDVYYGTFDGLFVASDSTDAVAGLRSSGDKLKVPGLPATTNGFLYIDVEHALPAIRAFAKLAKQKVPAQVDANLKPLKTLVVYGTRDGDVQSIVALLQVR
ncbi:MAG TPA: hypothetical protein VIL77_10685 [Gaiellaceae bacterium]